MIIKNASVYTENGFFQTKDIYIDKDRFAEREEQVRGTQVIDASGCYAIPGLTDIHFHGCMGYDFCDGTREAVDTMAAYEASVGVTNIVPATMTLSEETLFGICQSLQRRRCTGKKGPFPRHQYGRPFRIADKKGRTKRSLYPKTRYGHV